jgi:hypothetical protein
MVRTTRCGKGGLLLSSGQGSDPSDVMLNIAYVHPVNFLAPGSRDMHDANNKAVDYLYHALCQSEFDGVLTEDLACTILEQLKNAHAGNSQVQARTSLISPVSP